jgi:hypothetical protein
MSDLDWLARIETRRREWGGGFFLADAEVDFVLAAARAHLEATEDWYCEHGVSMGVRCQYCIESYGCGRKTALAMVPQPPQREDDDGLRRDSTDGSDLAGGPVDRIGGVSAVEHASVAQSEDAGLVERLRDAPADSTNPLNPLLEQAAAALEAKDAEKAQSIAMINELATMCNELKATIEAKDAEIERLEDKAENLDLAAAAFKMLHDKAQAEIERLKKAYPFKAWAKQKEEAQAEIERLRETLGRMVACPKCRYEPTEAP